MNKCFLTILLFIFVCRGCWSCSVTDIDVAIGPTGSLVKGKKEWTVIVLNKCSCPVSTVSLSCPDFNSVEPVDPSVLIRSADGRCLINQGHPILHNHIVTFKYAADSPPTLAPKQFYFQCA